MEDIHTSTRAAQASQRSTEDADAPNNPQELARSLAVRKKEIEEEIGIYIDVLRSNNADLNTPLLDAQGFPRHDLDVAAIRGAMNRIAMLRNDLNSVTSRLGLALEGVFTKPTQNGDAVGSTNLPNGPGAPASHTRTPLAKVNTVSPGSPAATAGLQVGDLVLSVGNVTNMGDLPALVAAHEDRILLVSILRAEEPLSLRLTPTKWEGRGLLGCHLLPI